jgi:hypothetical protein
VQVRPAAALGELDQWVARESCYAASLNLCPPWLVFDPALGGRRETDCTFDSENRSSIQTCSRLSTGDCSKLAQVPIARALIFGHCEKDRGHLVGRSEKDHIFRKPNSTVCKERCARLSTADCFEPAQDWSAKPRTSSMARLSGQPTRLA